MTEPLSTERILQALSDPWRWSPLLNPNPLDVPGFATTNLRRILNNICNFEGCRYLEVGTLHGASLIAAAFGNEHGYFFGLDNWSEFGGSEKSVWDAIHRIGQRNIAVIGGDATTISLYDPFLRDSWNVLFYDGHHAEDITRYVLIRFNELLADRFILIVDDWSWIGPRRGTEAAIAANGWRVEMKLEINDNYNRLSWGVGVAVILAEKRP